MISLPTYKTTNPEIGKILIAEPFLQDPGFKRTVIVITAYESTGILGFVLNNPSGIKASDLIPDFADWTEFDPELYYGGPVQMETLHFLHRLGEQIPDSVKINDNLWWSGDMRVLSELISKGIANNDNVKFLIGYSGWDAKQLQEEIKENSWIIAEPKIDLISPVLDRNSYWKTAVKSLGEKYKLYAEFPEDPSWN